MKQLWLVLLVISSAATFAANFAWGDEVLVAQNRPVRRYHPYIAPANPVDTRWATAHGPWDFSAQLAIYSPGFGGGVKAAYRVLNSILEDIDDSLSVEAGIGFLGASNTYGGVSSSYSLLEIPVLARWDFRVGNSKFVVGPNAGFSYMAGSSVTVNNVNYNTGTGLFFLIGGDAMYRFADKWAARADFDFGGYTSFRVGATYFY